MSDKRVGDLTPEQLAARRERDKLRKQRQRGVSVNATYKLDERGRLELAYLALMGLWTNAALAAAFGVHPTTVTRALQKATGLAMPHTSIRDATEDTDG